MGCICIHFVESPFSAITAASIFGDVSTRFAHLESVRLDGEHLWTAIFKSCHTFSIGFRSGLWLGRSNTWICFDLNHSIVAGCLGSLSYWKVNIHPSLLQTLTDSLLKLPCIWLHPSFYQLWPASLSLLKKSIPTTWCCHHPVSRWGWCVQGDVQC